ncbi:MAG: peptidylprolyl isomerase [Clostridia bacterium]|nr:peptidylprolyl isomerase [Clostridia bacterium]
MNTINAVIKLNNGKSIKLELYPDVAPISVENFVSLAEQGYFNGLCFHRVIPGFMIQGGGFVADGPAIKEKRGARPIKGEFSANGVKNDLSHTPGVISMARTQVMDSASSQFFICVDNCTFLDGQYAAFGKTADEESLKTAIEISSVPTHSFVYYDDVPNSPVVMTSVSIVK